MEPALYGLPCDRIPPELQVAADETPVQYGAKTKKTLVTSQEKQVRTLLSSEKRMTTGTPVTSRSGAIHVFQFIWKGKTTGLQTLHFA